MTADRKLRTDLMINICTYVPLFTRWKKHRVRATLEGIRVRVTVIFGTVKTIFEIYGYDMKSGFETQMRPEPFSTPSKVGESG